MPIPPPAAEVPQVFCLAAAEAPTAHTDPTAEAPQISAATSALATIEEVPQVSTSLVAISAIINLNMVDLPWSKMHPQPQLNMLGERLRARNELLGIQQGLDSFAMLSVGCDFEQALFHTQLETGWTEASAVQASVSVHKPNVVCLLPSLSAHIYHDLPASSSSPTLSLSSSTSWIASSSQITIIHVSRAKS
jgi:hypothetical protein